MAISSLTLIPALVIISRLFKHCKGNPSSDNLLFIGIGSQICERHEKKLAYYKLYLESLLMFCGSTRRQTFLRLLDCTLICISRYLFSQLEVKAPQ